jgi:hypothetical protein
MTKKPSAALDLAGLVIRSRLALEDRLAFVEAAFQRFGALLADPNEPHGLRAELNLEFKRLFDHVDGGASGDPFTLIGDCYGPLDPPGGPLDPARILKVAKKRARDGWRRQRARIEREQFLRSLGSAEADG